MTWWNGENLGRTISFDTETTLAEGLSVPALMLSVASNGVDTVAIHNDDIHRFVSVHASSLVYLYNAPFDFSVLYEFGINVFKFGKWRDLYILRSLINLAVTGNVLYRGSLEAACKEYDIDVIVDKENEARLTFDRIRDRSKEEIEKDYAGHLAYALNDASATYKLGVAMEEKASVVLNQFKGFINDIHPQSIAFGPLTIDIQTRSACVLNFMSRKAVPIDRATALERQQQLQTEVIQHEDMLEHFVAGIWSTKKDGSYRLDHQGNKRMNQAVLRRHLSTIEATKATISANEWRGIDNPFVRYWIGYNELRKQLSFLNTFCEAKPNLYTRYDNLKATGRTSARKWTGYPSLNIQQIPRFDVESDFNLRDLVKAEEGFRFFIVDYSYIELRTLAATCEYRYGRSICKLAQAIRRHTADPKANLDPHEVTACMMMGVNEVEWRGLDPKVRKKARQRAKAVNFGFPGGLGIDKLVDYARVSYGVEMTKAEAKLAKEAWFAAYPEMRLYLADSSSLGLAWNLGLSVRQVKSVIGNYPKALVRALGKGEVVNQFTRLLKLSGKSVEPNESLSYFPSATITGRIRGACRYTNGKNTPFQGLAADGAKIALWELERQGFNPLMFVHDEIVCYRRCHSEAMANSILRNIEAIMNKSMEHAMFHILPSSVEGVHNERWIK
jgi:DNA polymerase I-like protein with 3'-5' exonuclease and polymerase domains